jgi:Flp pilus assembly protein TadB
MARRTKRKKKHMARRRRSSGSTRVVVARAPAARAPIIRVSAPSHHIRRVRHHARSAGRAISSEKHTMVALAAAAAYGFVEKQGYQIPSIGPIGPAGTVGLAAWLYGRMAKNNTAQHLATGLLAIAVNRWVATGTIAGEGTAAYYDE